MSELSIVVLIAIVFLAMVWYVDRSGGRGTRTLEQSKEDWARRLRGTGGGGGGA